MDRKLSTGEQNLYLLNHLLPSDERFYISCYDIDGSLIGTSCPDDERDTLDYIFRLYDGPQKLNRSLKGNSDVPFMIASPAGAIWAAVPNHARNERFNIVIGPVFFSRIEKNQLHLILFSDELSKKNSRFLLRFLDIYDHLPVITYSIFARYAVIVHNMLNETSISQTDLSQYSESYEETPDPITARDRIKIYESEKAMLQMVRDGDLNYKKVLQNSVNLSTGVQVRGKEPLRQGKTSVIVFISLVCRAAMEGGLSPETAYSLGDSYIQSAENCRDTAELNILSHAMYHDFVYRVHQLKIDPGYSHAIQKCLNYIDLNIGKRINAADLASLVGYTEYYLTEKFKKETGMSVSTYIRNTRIRHAKMMLETTDQSIAEIAEALAFNTPNYFIQCFRADTGVTPARYRAEKRNNLL